MPKRSPKTQRDYDHTWFLQAWMAQAHPPLRQRDLIRELDWSKAKASEVYNGQRYTQELVDQLAPWLNVRPYELLMHPQEAMALRQLRESIATLVPPPSAPSTAVTPIRRKTG